MAVYFIADLLLLACDFTIYAYIVILFVLFIEIDPAAQFLPNKRLGSHIVEFLFIRIHRRIVITGKPPAVVRNALNIESICPVAVCQRIIRNPAGVNIHASPGWNSRLNTEQSRRAPIGVYIVKRTYLERISALHKKLIIDCATIIETQLYFLHCNTSYRRCLGLGNSPGLSLNLLHFLPALHAKLQGCIRVYL